MKKMQEFKVGTDSGSVSFGNEEFNISIPNIGGDGTTKVEVFKLEDYKSLYEIEELGYEYIGVKIVFKKEFNIYESNIIDKEWSVGKLAPGKYITYKGPMSVALLKIEK